MFPPICHGGLFLYVNSSTPFNFIKLLHCGAVGQSVIEKFEEVFLVKMLTCPVGQLIIYMFFFLLVSLFCSFHGFTMNLWKEKDGSELNELSGYDLIELAVFDLFCILTAAAYCESLHKLRE